MGRMPNPKCANCGKTAYPLESVKALDKVYHKHCFKCEECKMTLNLKNFKGLEGKIYCNVHVPVSRSSTSADSVAVKTAVNAPKKKAEALGQVQKGTGDKANVGLDAMGVQGALNAPKKKQKVLLKFIKEIQELLQKLLEMLLNHQTKVHKLLTNLVFMNQNNNKHLKTKDMQNLNLNKTKVMQKVKDMQKVKVMQKVKDMQKVMKVMQKVMKAMKVTKLIN